MKYVLALLAAAATLAAAPNDPAAGWTNAAGLKLVRELSGDSNANVCISPLSIQIALAMTYTGAAGKTKEQMASVLALPADPSVVAAGFQKLTAAVQSTTRGGEGTVRLANRLYGSVDYDFRPEFLSRLRDRFGAPLEAVDFAAGPDSVRETINEWVEERTEERIRNLIPPGALSADTALVLVNALFLKAAWIHPFSEAATAPAPFQITPDQPVDVPMMRQTEKMRFGRINQFTVVGLPLRAGFEFLVLLPKHSGTPEWPSDFSFSTFDTLALRDVELTIPKLRLNAPTVPLADTLKALGMTDAFGNQADFSGMAAPGRSKPLAISGVYHQTFLEIDEDGLEAAAATAVGMMVLSAPMQPEKPEVVRVDRPFLFGVRHMPTGALLFIGRITDPR